jgi:hypothetical protein
MKQKTLTKVLGSAALAVVSIVPSYAQLNLGSACGCPPVGSRTTVNMSTLTTDISNPTNNANAGVLTAANTVLTCDKIYIMDKKIYVDSLKSITIQPGTLIKGKKYSTQDSATMLIVQRGAKIFAVGTQNCPIVFTGFNDPMDGTYGVSNRGNWGGIALIGKAYNNLVSGQSKYLSPGVGFIEGFVNSNGRIHHGAAVADNNDNSGIMSHVSIRHSGAEVSAGNEIQGLTLASVGKGTSIDHIEIISSDDDGIELFGGTVDLKYITAMYGSDDMIDWDNGWNGRAQFIFGVQATNSVTPCADNGFESDGDDGSASPNKSNPTVYNVTLIGNGSTAMSCDNSGHAAIEFKDRTYGEISNSIFANFGRGLNLEQNSGTDNVYGNWTAGTLKLKCNTFLNTTNGSNGAGAAGTSPMTITDVATAVTATDTVKLNTDGNTHPTAVAGFDWTYAMNSTTNAVSDKYDAVPTTNLATSCVTPADGYFVPANYRGAFASNTKSWLSDWSYLTLVQTTSGNVPCPSDLNNDGITNNVDFLQLLGQFNQNCQ